MDNLKRVVLWLQSHKAAIGAAFLSLSAVVGSAGTIYTNDDLIHAAALLLAIGTALTGGGLMKSDQFHREKMAVIKTQIDRRNADSLIPVRDLKKLLADEQAAGRAKDITEDDLP